MLHDVVCRVPGLHQHFHAADASVGVDPCPVHLLSGQDRLDERRERSREVRGLPNRDRHGVEINTEVGRELGHLFTGRSRCLSSRGRCRLCRRGRCRLSTALNCGCRSVIAITAACCRDERQHQHQCEDSDCLHCFLLGSDLMPWPRAIGRLLVGEWPRFPVVADPDPDAEETERFEDQESDQEQPVEKQVELANIEAGRRTRESGDDPRITFGR